MTNILDVYDSEMKAITDLHLALNERAASQRLNYKAFEREIREKFGALGFTVDVNWYTFAIDGAEQHGVAMPEVTITGRTDPTKVFDPDQQVHEAVHDVLGIGESGWIKTDPETFRRFMDGQGGHDRSH